MTKTKINPLSGARDFKPAVRKALAAKGIAFVSTTWLPSTTGDYANGCTGYVLNDNGCQRLRTYFDVIALAN